MQKIIKLFPLLFFITFRPLVATEIVPTDFSSAETVMPNQALESGTEKKKVPPIQLRFPELLRIREVAQKAGGDLEVSIRPIGLTNEELAAALMKSGLFEIEASDDNAVTVVGSRRRDPHLERLQKEISQLEKHRNVLLNDIKVLQTLQEANSEPPEPSSQGLDTRSAVASERPIAPSLPIPLEPERPTRVMTLSP